MPLTHRQCGQRAGTVLGTEELAVSFLIHPRGKHGVPTDRAGLEAPEESTVLGDEGRKENRRVMLGGAGEGHRA